MSKFPQFLTELSAYDTSIFLVSDNNLSKCQWIQFCMCIDTVEICFGFLMGKFSQFLTVTYIIIY